MTGYNLKEHIRSTDIITVLYLTVSMVFILLLGGGENCLMPFLLRLVTVVLIIFIIYLSSKTDKKTLQFVHLFYPILLLTYFYGETAQFNQLIFAENLDPIFYNLEELVFGFQPSLEFSIRFPQKWFSELLNFGYFSYYILTFGVSFTFFILRSAQVEKVIFIIITSFFIYYLVFLIFPVVGPQYYFRSPLSDAADSGIFSRAVKLVQYYGEYPTGAFPSSHVGMVVIFLYLSFKNISWLFWIIMPLFALILMATVYIKAHYAIDVIAGLLSAPIVYYLANLLAKKIN